MARRLAVLPAFVLLLGGHVGTVKTPATASGASVRSSGLPTPPVRELAEARRIWFGTATVPDLLRNEADYAAVVGEQFDLVEPENAMKWDAIHPATDRYDFTGGDAIVAFAEAHGQTVRGHTLVWYLQNPAWLTALTPTRAEAIALLRDHISTVVGHYRGRVAEWDVVNEALDDASSGLRATFWRQWIGDDYLDIAFRLAHEADPEARLVYNDYDAAGVGAKSHRIVALAAALKRRGVPIDGVGLQFHLFGNVDEVALASVMHEAKAAGLTVSITELDVSIPLPTSPASLQKQADRFGAVVRGCVAAAPTCTTVNLWGFTDRHSWVPGTFPGFGAATPLDEHLMPKPAWSAIRKAFTDPPSAPTTTPTTRAPTTTAPPGDAPANPAVAIAGQPAFTG